MQTFSIWLQSRLLMPCPFTGPNNFWASPKIWLHLVPLQKLVCQHKNNIHWMQIIFLSGTKCLWLHQYVNKFLVWLKKFGPAQNIFLLKDKASDGWYVLLCSPYKIPSYFLKDLFEFFKTINANGQVGKTMITQLDIKMPKMRQLTVIFKSIKSKVHLVLDPSTLITQPFLMTLCIFIPGL